MDNLVYYVLGVVVRYCRVIPWKQVSFRRDWVWLTAGELIGICSQSARISILFMQGSRNGLSLGELLTLVVVSLCIYLLYLGLCILFLDVITCMY